MQFFGRNKELKKLQDLLEKRSSSLIVIKGRRRIGKSRLAQEFSKSMKTFTFMGLTPEIGITAQNERENFAKQLEINTGLKGIKAEDWNDLFWNLSNFTKEGRIIVILDEINWMGTNDPTFLAKLKTAWDLYFSQNSELIMILTGSMSGWIDRNILSSTGFLGRISLDLTIDELPLHQCIQFWAEFSTKTSAYEIFKILSVIGGVPRYLEEINPKISAEENLMKLCFEKEGFLFREFDNIFSDLFSRRAGIYKKIIQTLIESNKSIKKICEIIEVEKSGVISDYLDDLTKIGYISRDYTWSLKTGKDSKFSNYRLKDNYIRFYLKYIEPNKSKISRNIFSRPVAWDTIMGLQFENLILNNRHKIMKLIGIPVEEVVNENPYFQTKTIAHDGCQIDYLIQTKYNCLYLCEVKFSKNHIRKNVIQEIENKIDRLDIGKKRFSIKPILIHVNGVKDSIIKSGYFSKIIDFSQLLNSKSIT